LSDDEVGLAFFVMRAHFDPGSQRLPKELDQLKQLPDRQPWQISRQVTLPALQSGAETADVLLQEVPGIKDDQGLAAYSLSMGPNADGYAPDPSQGDGQYLVVLEGSVLHDNKEHKAPALVFVYPKDGPFQIHSGPQGLGGLVLNFPQVKPRAHAKTPSAVGGLKKWQCTLCAFAYDEAKGMPDEGIPAGTRWKDVPETWSCPDCAASKSDFQMVEV
jgi:rubredoxin